MDKAVCSQHPADRTALQTFANTKSRGRKSSKGGCWNIACGKKKKKRHLYTIPAYIMQKQHLLCWILLYLQLLSFAHFEESSRQSVGGGTQAEKTDPWLSQEGKENFRAIPSLQCFICSPVSVTKCSLQGEKHQGSTEAALWTTEDVLSLVAALISWWQTEVPTRGAEIAPQREGNTPCCP